MLTVTLTDAEQNMLVTMLAGQRRALCGELSGAGFPAEAEKVSARIGSLYAKLCRTDGDTENTDSSPDRNSGYRTRRTPAQEERIICTALAASGLDPGLFCGYLGIRSSDLAAMRTGTFAEFTADQREKALCLLVWDTADAEKYARKVPDLSMIGSPEELDAVGCVLRTAHASAEAAALLGENAGQGKECDASDKQ